MKLCGARVAELVRYTLGCVDWHRALHTDYCSEQAESWEYLTTITVFPQILFGIFLLTIAEAGIS